MIVHLHKESNTINSTTRRYHIAQAVYGSTRKYIPKTDLGNQRVEDRRRISSHHRVADDILVCANSPHELNQKLQELADETENQGLKMNELKTTVIMENGSPIFVNNTQIGNIEIYVYRGQRYNTSDTMDAQ